MSTEFQEEQASLYVLDALAAEERQAFERELAGDGELQQLVRTLRASADLLVLAVPQYEPSDGLKQKVLQRIAALAPPPRSNEVPPGLAFVASNDPTGWKPLPVPGAWIKLLSLERVRGYAVLLGRLEPGVHYPAHVNAGPEDFYILTGDLHIGDKRLGPGDFHHAERGSRHEVNHSVEGCTLLAVLTIDDPLVELAAT
jgi:hypothetical protein